MVALELCEGRRLVLPWELLLLLLLEVEGGVGPSRRVRVVCGGVVGGDGARGAGVAKHDELGSLHPWVRRRRRLGPGPGQRGRSPGGCPRGGAGGGGGGGVGALVGAADERLEGVEGGGDVGRKGVGRGGANTARESEEGSKGGS